MNAAMADRGAWDHFIDRETADRLRWAAMSAQAKMADTRAA
jgi:hypothetical protein